MSGIGGLLRTGTLGFGAIGAAADAANLYDRASQDATRFQDSLRFPLDLKDTVGVPYMSMQFSAYKRRSIYQQPFYQPEMKIRLPIPENLVERTSVNYDNNNLGSVAGAGVEALAGGLSGEGGSFAQRAAAVASGVGVASAQAALSNIVPGASQAANFASTLSGITTNPFQVVLFRSPDFRSHTFSWRFVPINSDESEMIRSIVETFKYHSLPGLSAAGGVFFSYPEILEISFSPDDYYLYKFKPCVVKEVAVNFAPSAPSFYRLTNAPTAVQFTINLQEIEIWTKADWVRNQERVGLQAGRLSGAETLGPTFRRLFGI